MSGDFCSGHLYVYSNISTDTLIFKEKYIKKMMIDFSAPHK